MPEQIAPSVLSLDLDSAFKDYNFSEFFDPTLKRGPSQSDLCWFVYRGRKGNRHDLGSFADAMYWTLRPAAFDCYQRAHGPVAIRYDEWFQSKLLQFLNILLLEQISHVTPGGVESVSADDLWDEAWLIVGCNAAELSLADIILLSPSQNSSPFWFDMVCSVSEHTGDRAQAWLEWLRRLRPIESTLATAGRRWGKNSERDQVIVNCADRGLDRRQICVELDKRTVPVLRALESRKIFRWVDGWRDPAGKQAIHSLISKVVRKACQVPSVAE